jgi:uncharacterized protein YjbI with pentapeptide repeats
MAELAAQRDGIAAAVSILGLIGGGMALYLLWRRTVATTRQANAALKTAEAALHASEAALRQADVATRRHEGQTEADRERRLMDAFAKAMEQLASDKLPTRLGAIYTLERISNESMRDYWPIMETLTAFVRERMRLPDQPHGDPDHDEDITGPPADIHSILTVIGRRNEQAQVAYENEDRKLDLSALDLRGTQFAEKSNFSRVGFGFTDLSGSTFWNCDLCDAYFVHATLDRVGFCAGTNLSQANFGSASLQYAYMSEADFHQNNFNIAILYRAYIAGADLRSAYNLTQEQINEAYGDKQTLLPPGLVHPTHWPEEANLKLWQDRSFEPGVTH